MTLVQFDLCKHLRWKSQSRDTGSPAAILASLQRSQTQFSCLHTCRTWGPDDDLVAPELCDRERTCFEQSRLVTPGSGAPVA
ncbi:MAG: hypothetical protein AAGA54_00595 [Myxococcota bacterium]